MPPAVSIIIPSYNKHPYVAATIESALAQTHPCEVIVVDDGSTDGSLDVVRTFEDRITLITGPNRGGCAARNSGMEAASGEYLQFLDADDILAKNKIEIQVAALETAPPGTIATCQWQFLNEDGTTDTPNPRSYWQSFEKGADFLIDMWGQGGYMPPHTWLVPNSMAKAIGPWNTNLTADQDGEYFGRLLLSTDQVIFCSGAIVQYRKPIPGTVSQDKSFRAAESRLEAYRNISETILRNNDTKKSRYACLNRIRYLGYTLSSKPSALKRADSLERRLEVNCLSPSLPKISRNLVALFGLEKGLKIRNRFTNFLKYKPK